MDSTTPKLTRAEAARINGAKSRGPQSEAGKQRSSMNALKFGFYTDQIILPGESAEEFNKLLDAYRQQFNPTNPLEYDLIQDLADSRWRIMRMKRMETLEWSQSAFDAAQDPLLAEVPYEILHEYAHRQNYQKKGCPLGAIRRAEARYHRDFDRALKTLHQNRKIAAATQPQSSAPQKPKNEPNATPPPQRPICSAIPDIRPLFAAKPPASAPPQAPDPSASSGNSGTRR